MFSPRMKSILKLAAIQLDAEMVEHGCEEPQFIDYLDAAADVLESMGHDMNGADYDILLDAAATYMANFEC